LADLPGNQAAHIKVERVKVGALTVLGLFSVRQLGRLLRVLGYHPLTAALIAVVGVCLLINPLTLAYLAGSAAIGLTAWRWRAADSFHRHVSHRARGAVRSIAVYRRKWRSALTKCEIIKEGAVPPSILRVTSSTQSGVDTLVLRMPDGHTVDHYVEHAAALAPTFGGFICQAKPVPNKPNAIQKRLPFTVHESLSYKPHQAQLQIATRDVLINPIEPPELDYDDPFPEGGWDIGLRGDSPTYEPTPFRFNLHQPLLIAGATQSGKTSIVRTMARAWSPGIAQGLIRPGAINPKGDVTLGACAHMFDRYVAGAIGGDITMFEEPASHELETYVKILRLRSQDLGEGFEEFVPSTKYPLVPVVIDEGALLVFYATNIKMRRRLRSAVAILASQGAGLGIVPIFLVQDPRVEIVHMRELFTRRFALRGGGLALHKNGELADAIPDDERHQGCAYFEEAGRNVVTRWRAYNTTVADIRRCPPKPALPPIVPPMRLSPVAMA